MLCKQLPKFLLKWVTPFCVPNCNKQDPYHGMCFPTLSIVSAIFNFSHFYISCRFIFTPSNDITLMPFTSPGYRLSSLAIPMRLQGEGEVTGSFSNLTQRTRTSVSLLSTLVVNPHVLNATTGAFLFFFCCCLVFLNTFVIRCH